MKENRDCVRVVRGRVPREIARPVPDNKLPVKLRLSGRYDSGNLIFVDTAYTRMKTFVSPVADSSPMIPEGRRFLLAGSKEEADHIREELRSLPVETIDAGLGTIRTVCGLDAAYAGEYSAGAAVVMTFPGLSEVCRATAVQRTGFPYIPGYLAFREGPVLYEAFQGLGYHPDLLLFNGHGRAHPEKFGLATHLGVLLGIPSIGVAKRPLAGFSYDAPDVRGGITPLTLGNETVGSVIRRRKGGGLLFISPGYRTDIISATTLVMETFGTHALPEPLWQADSASREFLAEYLASHDLPE